MLCNLFIEFYHVTLNDFILLYTFLYIFIFLMVLFYNSLFVKIKFSKFKIFLIVWNNFLFLELSETILWSKTTSSQLIQIYTE